MTVAKHLVRRELQDRPDAGHRHHPAHREPAAAVGAQDQDSPASRRRGHRAREARARLGRAGMAARRRSAHGARRLPRDHREFQHRRALRERASPRRCRACWATIAPSVPPATKHGKNRERRVSEFRAERALGWRERMARQVARAQRSAVAAGRRFAHAHGGPRARSVRLPGRRRRRLRPAFRRRLARRSRSRRLRRRQTVSDAHRRSARTRAGARVVPRQRAGTRARRARRCWAASSMAPARRSTGSVRSTATSA